MTKTTKKADPEMCEFQVEIPFILQENRPGTLCSTLLPASPPVIWLEPPFLVSVIATRNVKIEFMLFSP